MYKKYFGVKNNVEKVSRILATLSSIHLNINLSSLLNSLSETN